MAKQKKGKTLPRVNLSPLILNIDTGEIFAKWHQPETGIHYLAIQTGAAMNSIFDVYACKNPIEIFHIGPMMRDIDGEVVETVVGHEIPKAVELLKARF